MSSTTHSGTPDLVHSGLDQRPDNPLINDYRQAGDYFFRSISIDCLDIGQGVTAYMSGVPEKGTNVVYVKQDGIVTEDTVLQINRFYDVRNLEFEVMIPVEHCQEGLADLLKTHGYLEDGKSVAMAINLENKVIASLDDEATIKPTNANLTDWMIPLIEAFDSTPEVTSLYAHCHENALSKGAELYHYTLYRQGQPIYSLTLSIQGKNARIDDVGTVPEFQAKGNATSLVKYALLEASKLGASHCFLESSVSGLSIYQKIGFQTLFRNRYYSRQKSD
jgi:GNAT superfamily N-acetyltransferase